MAEFIDIKVFDGLEERFQEIIYPLWVEFVQSSVNSGTAAQAHHIFAAGGELGWTEYINGNNTNTSLSRLAPILERFYQEVFSVELKKEVDRTLAKAFSDKHEESVEIL